MVKKGTHRRDSDEEPRCEFCVPRLFRTRHFCARIFWCIICVMAFLIFVFQLSGLVQRYLHYPTSVAVRDRPVESHPWPWVTICNINHLDPLTVEQIEGFLLLEEVANTAFTHKYEEYQQSGALFVQAMMSLSTLDSYPKDAFGLYSRYGLTANVGVMTASLAGVKLPDLVYSCRFGNRPCNVTQSFLTFFYPFYFNCFTFKANVQDQVHSSTSGPKNGLILDLFLGSAGVITRRHDDGYAIPGMEEAGFPPASGHGVKVVLHQPNTQPYPIDEGYDIPVGFGASLGVQISESKRLPPPWGNCRDDVILESSHNYTIKTCYNECLQKRILDECGCIDSTMSTSFLHTDEGKHPFCYQLPESVESECGDNPDAPSSKCGQLVTGWKSVEICRSHVHQEMLSQHFCDCPQPCYESSYQASYSLAKLPEYPGSRFQAFVQTMDPAKKEILHRAHGDFLGNLTSRVHVYLLDRPVTSYVESPATTLADLFADIGGQTALWVLVILISSFELVAICTGKKRSRQ